MNRCSHPRNAEDAATPTCRTCNRVRAIVQRVEREQARLNDDRMTLGQRIAAGLL